MVLHVSHVSFDLDTKPFPESIEESEFPLETFI